MVMDDPMRLTNPWDIDHDKPSETKPPEGPTWWVLTRHNHPDFDESIYTTLQDAMDDAELDSDALPEGEYHHKPRPLYDEETVAELRRQLAEAVKANDEVRALCERAGVHHPDVILVQRDAALSVVRAQAKIADELRAEVERLRQD